MSDEEYEDDSQDGWMDFYHDNKKELFLDFLEHEGLTDAFKAFVKQQYKEALEIIDTNNSLILNR